MNPVQKLLSAIPLPISGLMLAIASLGILSPQFFEGILPAILPAAFSPIIATIFYGACGIISAAVWILLILKAAAYPSQIRSALCDPVLASVLGTFPMATMVLAVYLKMFVGDAAVILWYVGLLLHMALIIWYTVSVARKRQLNLLFPSWLVVYAGIIICPITAPFFNQILVGQGIWWFGVCSILLLTPLLVLRAIKLPLADPIKPLVCIFAAPVSIALAGYVQCFEEIPAFVTVLLLLETVVLILILCKLPILLRLPFYPSYAAFTFPFVVTATAYVFGMISLVESGVAAEPWLLVSAAVFLLSAGLVFYVLVRYCMAVRKMVLS